MTRFGDFQPLCSSTPSYPWCNLFYRQLLRLSPQTLTGLSSSAISAPVGVNPQCGIPRVGYDGSIGNVANIVVCGISILFVSYLIYLCNRRKAAVGRIEHRFFLILYLLTLPFQLLTTGSFLEQGSTSLVVLTAIHAGFVAAFFWSLLANAIVSTQIVEDGTPSSLIPFYLLTIAILCGTTYISLDVALGVTQTLGGPSNPVQSIRSIPLFFLTSIWPAAATFLYLVIMTYIVLTVLQETRPMFFYLLAAALFVLSQLDYFLLNRVICKGANGKTDGSFVATILETAAVGMLYLAWRSITESAWEDETYFN
ncbi:chitin synthase III catalytic subunit [Amanita rubescens]|nr:chitin synthase III catalytic subunit [Amanita rubescens]